MERKEMMKQGSANIFSDEPDSKSFRLFGLYGLLELLKSVFAVTDNVQMIGLYSSNNLFIDTDV